MKMSNENLSNEKIQKSDLMFPLKQKNLKITINIFKI